MDDPVNISSDESVDNSSAEASDTSSDEHVDTSYGEDADTCSDEGIFSNAKLQLRAGR